MEERWGVSGKRGVWHHLTSGNGGAKVDMKSGVGRGVLGVVVGIVPVSMIKEGGGWLASRDVSEEC